MAARNLVVLSPPDHPESPADRIRRLQTEARSLAREHVEMLVRALSDVSRLADEIADGGEAYPVGARELSRRLTEDCGMQAMTLSAILDRL
jgi:hypothetical protein